MVSFNLTFDLNVSLEQRIGFTLAAALYENLFTDTTPINIHIGATDSMDNDKAVGGAVPIFHEVHYGVYQQYLANDVSSDADHSALEALQDGNTVDVLIDGQRVDGNTKITLTRAQAKALGMTEALVLEDGSTWTRDMVQDPEALDGYIVINNSYDWSYDFTREAEAAPNTLDFLTMALHELGHSVGFVSGLDGLMKSVELHSGETRTEGFTGLDLFRYSDTSASIDHPNGSVNDLSVGEASYFSLDGGKTAIAEFEEGDEYQASHWQRSQNALGIMDPTLGYQERTSLSHLDLQAFDVLGWDIDYDAYQAGLDLNDLYNQALNSISEDFEVGVEAIESAIANEQDWHTLVYGSWWQDFQQQMLELGHAWWWQESEEAPLELRHAWWWQELEEVSLELRHAWWWQELEEVSLELRHAWWWQELEEVSLELRHAWWWQELDPATDIAPNSTPNSTPEEAAESPTDGPQQSVEDASFTVTEGKTDDILSGNEGDDLINGQLGDDLIDGAEGDDIILGGKGNDIIYGWHGSDMLYGGEGDDFLTGENDADSIHGEDGHDVLTGGHGDDTLDGGVGNDVLTSEKGSDRLIGGSGEDRLNGGDGNDELYGDAYLPIEEIPSANAGESVQPQDADSIQDNVYTGMQDQLIGGPGNDQLSGGLGNDILNGTDDHAAGAFEQDILIGGDGRDRFILGDTHQSYYRPQGIEDYAMVMDFDPHLDVVQLHGTVNSYQQEQQGQDVWLRYENDLIAIFNATDTLSLASPSVEFV